MNSIGPHRRCMNVEYQNYEVCIAARLYYSNAHVPLIYFNSSAAALYKYSTCPAYVS